MLVWYLKPDLRYHVYRDVSRKSNQKTTMTDVELQELDDVSQSPKRAAPRRPADQLTNRARPRGLIQQITAVLMRPAHFFYSLTQAGESRQWVVAALLMLALIGASAVRYQTLSAETAAPSVDTGGGEVGGDFGGDPGMGGEFGEGGGDFGGVPPGGDPNAGGGTTTASTTTDDLTTALVADADVILGWFILTLILTVVPMFNGRAPKLGMGLQVAVWASAPIALMSAVQLLYYAGGGQPGADGLTGLLPEYEFYTGATPFMQALMLSAAGKMTLFWFWSVMLAHFGARYALNGKRIVVPVVVACWVIAQIFLPVASGKIKAPEAAPIVDDMGGGDMGGGELMIDPVTGYPIDPMTGLPFDPATGMPIDPNTGRPVDTEVSPEVAPIRSGGKPGG